MRYMCIKCGFDMPAAMFCVGCYPAHAREGLKGAESLSRSGAATCPHGPTYAKGN